MTETTGGRTVIAVTVAVVLVAVAVGVGSVLGAAQNADADLACVGSGGGAAYVTDSNLTVYENDTDGTIDTFYFPESDTVRFAYQDDGLNVTGEGDAELRLENGTGDVTCLGDVDTDDDPVDIVPDANETVTLNGSFDGISFRDVEFNEDSPDLVYDGSPETVTVAVDSDDGTTIEAIDSDDGSTLDSAEASDGNVTWNDIPGGEHEINVEEEDDGGGGGGGSSGGSTASPSPDPGTEVTVDDPDAADDGTADGEGSTDDSSAPDTSVRVTNPEPGQTLVIENGQARMVDDPADLDEDAPDEADTDETDTDDEEPADDDTDDETADDDADDETAADPATNVRADRLSVDINTDRDFELSVTTYESDLTRSATIGQGTPAASTGAVQPLASGVSMASPLASTAQAEEELAPAEVQQAAESFESETGTVSAGYVEINHTMEPEEIAGATFEFSIRQAYLEELGVEHDAVELHHQAADEDWNVRNTTHISSDATHHQYEGTMPEFSVFALGTTAPTMTVTDLGVDAETVEVGESVDITATVENRGQTAGEKTVTLYQDGSIIADATVEVAGDDTETVSFEETFDAEGDYELAIEEHAVVVTADTEPVESEPEPEPDEDDQWTFTLVVAIVVLGLTLIVLVVWRR